MMDGAIAIEMQHQLVFARRNVKSLEDAVEVVDDSRIVAVDIDLRIFRLHLDANRRAIPIADAIAVLIGVWRIKIRIGVRIPEPVWVPRTEKGIVKKWIVEAGADHHAGTAAELRRGWGRPQHRTRAEDGQDGAQPPKIVRFAGH